MAEPAISVVIPAHDEAAVIARLLGGLGTPSDRDEVVVVCDGCSDGTADIARRFPGVRVVEQEQGGKPSALNAGDRVTTRFPRFYVDADIRVSLADLRSVAAELTGQVLAGAPRMQVDTDGASWVVRRFYDVWTRLPYATTATLGSGVIGLTEQGRSRFGEWPPIIADDEMVRRLFTVEERLVDPPGTFVVTTPRRLSPLISIKTRSELGALQLDELAGPATSSAGAPGISVVPRLARDPRRWPSLAVFTTVRAIVGLRAHRRFRRGQVGGWARDDSSRGSAPARAGLAKRSWAAVWRRSLRWSARDETRDAGTRSCVVVAPHPDDETLGCGATIARKRATGTRVAVVVLTDGRGSTTSEVISPDELATLRAGELRSACAVLGLDPDDVHQLDIADGELPDRIDEATLAVRSVIEAVRPDDVMVTSSLDPHPDHRAAAEVARRAIAQLDAPRPRLLEYPIWSWANGPGRPRPALHRPPSSRSPFPARRPVSVRTEGFLDAKRAAVAHHASQVTNLTGEDSWAHFTPQQLEVHLGDAEIFLAPPSA